jgi:endonuclease/exonuclease/phosphatase family metal-dependent hydrolase
VRVLTWNLFHGRTVPVCGRDRLNDFAAALDGWAWDVALLQEVPPWWPARLARACGARERTVLTSRNWLLPARRAISIRNPDVLKANGGGCNAILVRGEIREHRTARLAVWPERRTTHGISLANGWWIANLHATNGRGSGLAFGHAFDRLQDLTPLAARPEYECKRAAELALDWAGGAPLVFGGDLNKHRAPALPGLRHIAGNHVDHVYLGPGLRAGGRGEVLDRGELSDHAPVVVTVDSAA